MEINSPIMNINDAGYLKFEKDSNPPLYMKFDNDPHD